MVGVAAGRGAAVVVGGGGGGDVLSASMVTYPDELAYHSAASVNGQRPCPHRATALGAAPHCNVHWPDWACHLDPS